MLSQVAYISEFVFTQFLYACIQAHMHVCTHIKALLVGSYSDWPSVQMKEWINISALSQVTTSVGIHFVSIACAGSLKEAIVYAKLQKLSSLAITVFWLTDITRDIAYADYQPPAINTMKHNFCSQPQSLTIQLHTSKTYSRTISGLKLIFFQNQDNTFIQKSGQNQDNFDVS